jgi:hypothetical protein
MDNIRTSRIDKLSSKKDRSNGPYSAKHIRQMEQIMANKLASVNATRSAKI